jgi:hypothetical protein
MPMMSTTDIRSHQQLVLFKIASTSGLRKQDLKSQEEEE